MKPAVKTGVSTMAASGPTIGRKCSPTKISVNTTPISTHISGLRLKSAHASTIHFQPWLAGTLRQAIGRAIEPAVVDAGQRGELLARFLPRLLHRADHAGRLA